MGKWDEPSERFVNPYNFVPLEDKCERQGIDSYILGKRRLTGYIDCTLKLLTPLIIPNTSNNKALHGAHANDAQEGNSYDFYSYCNLENGGEGSRIEKFSKPVIPGSELRGTVRNVFEAAFNGCLSSVDLKRKMHRRTMTVKTPGILRRNKNTLNWEIEECGRVKIQKTDAAALNEGQRISLKYSRGMCMEFDVCTRSGHGWKSGYFHRGEYFEAKKYESIFVSNDKILPVHKEELETLTFVLKQYADEKINRHLGGGFHQGYNKYHEKLGHLLESTCDDAELLVYYSTYKKENKLYAGFLSPAMISKEVFRTSVEDLLRANGQYQPCADREEVCPACALFGMVGKVDKLSLASRVRFADASIVERESDDKEYYRDYLLPELAEPKPGTVEFYTAPPLDAEVGGKYRIWTYDYLKNNKELQLLQPKQLRLRGRKFYWHNSKLNVSDDDGITKLKQRVRAVKERQSFSFKVYFDRITEKELAELQWALTFNDPEYAHKFGRGKPAGFGSGTIRVEQIYVRQLDQQTGTRSMINYDAIQLKLLIQPLSNSQQTIKLITRWQQWKAGAVSYPKVRNNNSGSPNDEAAHQWFAANKKDNKNFLKILPTIEEETDHKLSGKWLRKK